MRPLAALASLALVFLLLACNGESASEPTPLPSETEPPPATATLEPAATATVTTPDVVPSTQIQVPEGFTAYQIGQDFFRPTSVALAPDGTIYVALRHDGIVQLRDNDGDGVFEQNITFLAASNSAGEYGEFTGVLVSDDNRVYISDRGRVTIAEDVDGDGVADSITPIITGLPTGLHQIDGIEFGPDGLLYITNGSTCDECVETDVRAATILTANPDGSNLTVYASGLRNPYDIAFDSQGRLWATDNGSDGGEAPFCASIDELNLIEPGADYGWPYAPGCDPYQSGTAPVASLGLHTGSTGIDVYDGSQFPAEYSGDLFLTLWGSFVFEAEFAPELYRYTPGDTEIQPFSSGFEHPIDVLTDTDGSLLVLDYGLGALFRIVYSES
ncbi:MAG: PQQ-dependent sugar dehydrogenase [Chloroflexi bacterium]|nr:PQQ-dependent sugar dehydrogenase [Chloroflexota bacterium]